MPETPKLTIEVRFTAHPSEIPTDQMDRLLDGELAGFQAWVIERNKQAGLQEFPLSLSERMVVKSYLLYAATQGER